MQVRGEKALINDKTRNVHKNVLEHATKGCYSDPRGLDVLKINSAGEERISRGTNVVEAFFRKLNKVFRGIEVGRVTRTCQCFDTKAGPRAQRNSVCVHVHMYV